MLLFFAASLSIAMACFVGVAGQERRVKIWFLLLCASTTLLSIGLWIEINVPNWAFFAARANMTSAFMIAAMGVGSHFGVTIQLEENQRFNRKRVFENIHLN